MAITVNDKPNGATMSGSEAGAAGSSSSLPYLVECTGGDLTANADAVRAAVATAAPSTLGSQVLRKVNVDDHGGGFWSATAVYGDSTGSIKPVADTTVVTMSVRATTQHITQSKETIMVYGPSGVTVPNYKGAIGVTSDGVEGCDIKVPSSVVDVTRYMVRDDVTTTYLPALEGLAGKVNDAPLSIAGISFAEGELLLTGATIVFRGASTTELVEIQIEIEVSRNATGLSVGPDITGIDKKGWEYLWVKYDDVEDVASNTVTKVPRFAVVERVYDSADYSVLV